MNAFQDLCQPSVTSCQPSEPAHPANIALDTPEAGQQHNAAFHVGQLDHLQMQTMVCGLLARRLAGVSLIGRGDTQRQQVSQSVNRQMYLGAISTRLVATLRRTLQRLSVENHRAGLRRPVVAGPDQFTKIGDDGLEDIGIDPAARLRGSRRPRQQAVQHTPLLVAYGSGGAGPL